MSLNTLILLKLLIDTGLVVLILMVQLTIYPSFLFYKRSDLIQWHLKYTKGIAIIVGPLMVAQLFIAVYVVFGVSQYTFGGLYLLFVLATWISTALFFVPIHNRITANTHSKKDLENLVLRNWLRVLLWIVTFLVSLLHYAALK